jgi:hypothetical protein
MTVLAVSRCCYSLAYSDVCQLGVVGGANDGGLMGPSDRTSLLVSR